MCSLQDKVFVIRGAPYQVHVAQHMIRVKVGDVSFHFSLLSLIIAFCRAHRTQMCRRFPDRTHLTVAP